MTDITTITDHVKRALKRSLTQYRGKEKHEGFITAVVNQVQDIEDAIFFMIDARSLAQATGLQLDNLGTLVGRARGGFDDDFYRILLYVQIGQNTSQGGAEKIINIYKLLTESSLVHYANLNTGSIMLGADAPIAQDQINFIYQNMELVAAGGVRIDHLVCFDPLEPFAFAGNNTDAPGAGWSDITGAQGGKFAELHRNKVGFAFAGNDLDSRGWGSLKDPIAGGVFAGIGG